MARYSKMMLYFEITRLEYHQYTAKDGRDQSGKTERQGLETLHGHSYKVLVHLSG